MGNKLKLNSELIDAICERIRVGSYPYIAAAACGVSKSTYYRWMATAERKGARKIYRELKDRVSEAAAAARSNAEVRVFRDAPFQWLRYGPGHERSGEPGWTETPTTLRVEGGESPVQLQPVHPIPIATLGAAFAELERLGFIQPGPNGQLLFESAEADGPGSIDVQSTPTGAEGSGNGRPSS